GSAPERVNSSVWQTPVALISTSTSPAFGPSRSTSSMTSGLPAAYATAARVFMGRNVAPVGPVRIRDAPDERGDQPNLCDSVSARSFADGGRAIHYFVM